MMRRQPSSKEQGEGSCGWSGVGEGRVIGGEAGKVDKGSRHGRPLESATYLLFSFSFK